MNDDNYERQITEGEARRGEASARAKRIHPPPLPFPARVASGRGKGREGKEEGGSPHAL